jgi:ribosomal-protein-alanine N-acetyltransferase
MRQADVEVLVPLAQQLFPGDPPWTTGQFQSELSGVPDTRWYVVAETDSQVVGYAGLMVAGETAELQTLAVAPVHQRRGIATMLLAALIAEAQLRGARALMLEVRAENEAALGLYTRHRFEQISRRRGYYDAGRTDALVLRRSL